MVGDIVTYELLEPIEGYTEALGVILEGEGEVQPLCRWSLEVAEFLWDEELALVGTERIRQRLNQDGVFPESRMAPRHLDPHGEHSEDFFMLRPPTLPLPEGTFVALRPEREANW